jgi:hypothetical protein
MFVFTVNAWHGCCLIQQGSKAYSMFMMLDASPVLVPCALPALLPPLLLQRVLFDPNKGDIDRINDYTANVYFGEVDIAEADPVIAAAGGVVSGRESSSSVSSARQDMISLLHAPAALRWFDCHAP